MPIACIHLEPLLNEAVQLGAKVSDVVEGWSKVNRVVVMADGMPTATAAHAINSPGIRVYKNHGSPHNAPDEGIICDACGVAVSFTVGGAS